jgi:hypothetical protein
MVVSSRGFNSLQPADEEKAMTPDSTNRSAGHFGLVAVALGGVALIAAVIHFFGGPFAPQNSIGVSLGEIAADATKSVLRNFLGRDQPAAAPLPWDVDRVIWLAVAATGALAVVLSVVAMIRHEPRRVVIGGLALGIGAIVFQFAAYVVLAVLVIMLIGVLFGKLGLG